MSGSDEAAAPKRIAPVCKDQQRDLKMILITHKRQPALGVNMA